MSHSQVGRIERGLLVNLTIDQIARLATVVGLDLSVRLYPGLDPIRDAAHVRLLERFRRELHSSLSWSTEVPLPNTGDLRAWDAVVTSKGWRIPIEAETRVEDAQALQRRVAMKVRDGAIRTVILVAADTARNRAALAGSGAGLVAAFPGSARTVLAALRAGTRPEQSAIVIF